jgi:selenide,water dikinase
LVGYDTADDAGVYLLREDLAIVQTVDFFTPIVDDPYAYGRIAAVNSLSDVWAMGGEPITALSIAAFPREGVSFEVLGEIMRGGLDTLVENGVALLGGHTIDDKEIKYGYAVTGVVHPEKIVTNAGARPGDALVLTKPLGTGIISTAIKFDRVPPDSASASLTAMLQTSRDAARLMVEHGAHGATDVTGFGLLGHGAEFASASQVTLVIDSHSIPLLPNVLELAASKNTTRGGRANREYLGNSVRIAEDVDPNLVHVLYDPQTAGGLLIACPTENAETLTTALERSGYTDAVVIGRCEAAVGGLLIDIR